MNMNNRKLFGLYKVFYSAMPIWFVFLLFLLSKGLDYTEAILLDSFSAFTAILFEVPSGVLADKMSRKKLLIIGESIVLVNFTLLLFFNSYIIIAIGALLSGIGSACVSGTSEALVYDDFVYNNETDDYKAYAGKVKKWSFVAVAVMSLCSGFLFEVWTKLPMIISIVFQLAAVICLCFVKEHRLQTRKAEEQAAETSRYRKWLNELKNQLNIIKRFFKNKKLIGFCLLQIIFLEVISNINYTTQAYLPELGLDIKYLGIALCIFNLISALGAKYTEKAKLNGSLWICSYIVILLILCTGNLIAVIVALSISRFIGGFIFTVLSNEQNKEIASEERATVLSAMGLIVEICPLILDPMIGVLYDTKGFRFAFLILAVALAIIIAISKIHTRHTVNQSAALTAPVPNDPE